MASILPGLRRAAPRISKDFFICYHCLKHSRPRPKLQLPIKSNLARNIRFNSTATALPHAPKDTSPLSSLSKTISDAESQKIRQRIAAEAQSKSSMKSFFPATSSNAVAYWLLASAGSVFGIVVFGGLTRLTESGYLPPSPSPSPKPNP
jgi:heme a synthase